MKRLEPAACEQHKDDLAAVAVGAIAERDAAVLRGHVEACEGCRLYLASLERTVGAVRALPRPDPSAETTRRILEAGREAVSGAGRPAVEDDSPWTARLFEFLVAAFRKPAFAAAAVGLAVAIGIVVVSRTGPGVEDSPAGGTSRPALARTEQGPRSQERAAESRAPAPAPAAPISGPADLPVDDLRGDGALAVGGQLHEGAADQAVETPPDPARPGAAAAVGPAPSRDREASPVSSGRRGAGGAADTERDTNDDDARRITAGSLEAPAVPAGGEREDRFRTATRVDTDTAVPLAAAADTPTERSPGTGDEGYHAAFFGGPPAPPPPASAPEAYRRAPPAQPAALGGPAGLDGSDYAAQAESVAAPAVPAGPAGSVAPAPASPPQPEPVAPVAAGATAGEEQARTAATRILTEVDTVARDERELAQQIAVSPEHAADATLRLAGSYASQGRWAEAARTYDLFLARYLDDPRANEARWSAAEAYRRAGTRSRAAALYRQLVGVPGYDSRARGVIDEITETEAAETADDVTLPAEQAPAATAPPQ